MNSTSPRSRATKETFHEMLARTLAIIFWGRTVECPCCGRTFRVFLYTTYLTGKCPYCGSYERYRLLCMYLKENTDFHFRPIRVLEIGPCGCFAKHCSLYENVDYTSIDISSPLADFLMDIQDIEFDDSTFDCVVCYHVLEHVKDDLKAMSEIHRILRPGGYALVQVPFHDSESTLERSSVPPSRWREIFRYPDHLRVYGKDFRERLESQGFDVEISGFIKGFNSEQLSYYGLDGGEDIYVCRKGAGSAVS